MYLFFLVIIDILFREGEENHLSLRIAAPVAALFAIILSIILCKFTKANTSSTTEIKPKVTIRFKINMFFKKYRRQTGGKSMDKEARYGMELFCKWDERESENRVLFLVDSSSGMMLAGNDKKKDFSEPLIREIAKQLNLENSKNKIHLICFNIDKIDYLCTEGFSKDLNMLNIMWI